ncbi:DUF6281 family protein [Streptomyces sp. FR-108]|uniref:DUF6281 family protein n=1 Tax=Streptomyces sp. FR-108 TaxID=3416665 RepID=UPI003CE92A0B
MLAASSLFCAAACDTASSGADGGSAASCAFAVQFRGELYTRVRSADFTVRDELGSSRPTLCDDTGEGRSAGTAATETYATYRIEELDAGTAVAVRDEPDEPDESGRRDRLSLYVLQRDGGIPAEAEKFLDPKR